MQISNEVRLRSLMGRFLGDIVLWAKGYVDPSQQELDLLLHHLSTALPFADAATATELQTMVAELEDVRLALLRSDLLQDSHLLAKQMVAVVQRIRDGSTSALQGVEMMEIIGKNVIYVDTTFRQGILVGRVATFKRASRDDRELLIGDVVLQPTDEQLMWTHLSRQEER